MSDNDAHVSRLKNVCLGYVDKPNANGDIFPRVIMERELKKRFFDGNQAMYGTIGSSGDNILLSDVTHVIKDARIDDYEIRGTIELVGNADINARAGLVEAVDHIELQPFGYGTMVLDEDGNAVVQSDFVLTGFNIIDPTGVYD